jgi:hypothetical protein
VATTTTVVHDEGAVDPTARNAAPSRGTPGRTSCESLPIGRDPVANAYHPSRLEVIRRCVSISGTVMSVRSEDDGDTHFDLRVDPRLVNAGNVAHQHGWLVVEIDPADKPGCVVGQPPRPATGTYDYGTCTGANVATPAVGARVTVTGPYLLDTNHGWMEVHPAWSVIAGDTTVSGSAQPQPTSPPPATTPPAGSVYYPNCAAARAAGVTPLHRGQPGYRSGLDRDHDGIACE